MPNLESTNLVLIHQHLSSTKRLMQLNAIAITLMHSLVGSDTLKRFSEAGTHKGIAK